MAQPVVWEGSAFAECLAEALAEDTSSEPTQESLLLETVAPPDAAAAQLLAGLDPERAAGRHNETDGAGPTNGTKVIQTYAQNCKQLVHASMFGSRKEGRAASALKPGEADGIAVLPNDKRPQKGTIDVQLDCGWEKEWLDRGRLAGGAGWLLSAAAALVVPLRLVNSDRPGLAAAIGLTSLPVLAVAASQLYTTTADACLILLLQRNLDALGCMINGMTTLQHLCKEAIRTIQEVELLARGYNVVPNSSNALPPISRLERKDRERRCQSLRTAVAACLLRARTAVSEAHQRVETELSNMYSDAASRRSFRPAAAAGEAAIDTAENMSVRGTDGSSGGADSLGDIRALKAASRGLQDETGALLATLLYRIAKLGRRSAMPEFELSVGFGCYWNCSDAAESFISQLSIILERLDQEIALLNIDLEDSKAHSLNAHTSVHLKSDDQSNMAGNSSAAICVNGSSGSAAVRFQAGLVDIYHSAHKLSSRALLFHSMVCNPAGSSNSRPGVAADALGNVTSQGSIDLASSVALKQEASSMLNAMRLDLQSCTSLVDASESALTDLITRLDGTSGSSGSNDDGSDNTRAAKDEPRTDVIIESDPGPLPVTTEVFECKLETLSSGITDDRSKQILTAEQQREIRKARMAARKLEREERIKREAEAEKAAAAAKQFYNELQAVVGSRDI